MKNTGIKVWVLTGDKIETAMNIGVSAGLLDGEMAQHLINVDRETDLEELLKCILEEVETNAKKKIH